MANKVIENIDVWTECSCEDIASAFMDGYKDGKFIYDSIEFLPQVKTVFEIKGIKEEKQPQFKNALVFYKDGVPVRIAFPKEKFNVPMALIQKNDDSERILDLLEKAGIEVQESVIDKFDYIPMKFERPSVTGHAEIESVCERCLFYAFLGGSTVALSGDQQNETVWEELIYTPNFEMTMRTSIPGFDIIVKHKNMLIGKKNDNPERPWEITSRAIIMQEGCGISNGEILSVLNRIQSEKLDPQNPEEKPLVGLTVKKLTILQPNKTLKVTGQSKK